MGARKRISAEARKEAQKTMYFAKLNNVPTSPRKMRLVADMIRGMEVFRALGVLKFSNKEAAARVEKLLRSAIANWEQKNERKHSTLYACRKPTTFISSMRQIADRFLLPTLHVMLILYLRIRDGNIIKLIMKY